MRSTPGSSCATSTAPASGPTFAYGFGRANGGEPEAFERRLRAALPAVRVAGLATSLETGDFFPERGRFDTDDLTAVHAVFEADSEAVSTLLAGRSGARPDRRAAAALRRAGAGVGAGAPGAACAGARAPNAADAWTQLDSDARRESDAGFRRHARPLRAALTDSAAAADPLPGPGRGRRPAI